MFLSKVLVKNKELCSSLKMNFSAGPYNPYRYKDYFVPRNLPKFLYIKLLELKKSKITLNRFILFLLHPLEMLDMLILLDNLDLYHHMMVL